MTPDNRSIIYTSAAGLIPILVAAGFLSDALGQAVLNLIASAIAVFALVMARKNTPTKKNLSKKVASDGK